ncbi:hypothetical protein HDU87_000742 [Geranomyces variabilis]|uniref:Nucleotide-diphospho-sugar transferase n=1 Tax=Geranomyces variabilis TaxID=109894 RepID=A0AAD5TT40_9FUNG|nr:hypothetical protein HDU87_000742 [Geranomyces variabilis]
MSLRSTSLTGATTKPPPSPANKVEVASTVPAGPKRNLAYVFYVTSDTYACACMVLVASIKKAGKRADIGLVALVTASVSKKRLDQLAGVGIRTMEVASMTTHTTDPTWRESLTRLAAFKLVEFDRIVVLDADGTVLKSLDFLFDLPSFPIYAPRAYWLDQPFLASTVYVIEPSQALYDAQVEVIEKASKEGETLFDMDVANRAFKDVASFLPGTIALLNGDFNQSPLAKSAANPFLTYAKLWENPYYVHFSESPLGGYGKPWSGNNRERRIVSKPHAHPLYRSLFETYWTRQDEFCK